jgi:hypothetical protein
MRAAPGFAPQAIARLSRRIDIAKTLFTASPKVAENRELRVNPGAVGILVMACRESGKWVGSRRSDAADPKGRICLPISMRYGIVRAANPGDGRAACVPMFARTSPSVAPCAPR